MPECNGKYICQRIFCHNLKKEVKCSSCGVYLCRCCDIKIKGKTLCFDCVVKLGFAYAIGIDINRRIDKNAQNLY